MLKQLPLIVLLFGITSSFRLSGQSLMHYWNFNTSSTELELLTPTFSLQSGSAIAHIPGGISAIQITSNINQGFEIENLNARNGDESGTHLRFNDPIGGALVFSLPTTGYQQIVVKYSTRRSGSGAGTQIIQYSTDGIVFDTLTTIDPVDGNPSLQTLDFSSITDVNDNPDFKIMITFLQGPGGLAGNNRFDNVTVEGIASGADVIPPVATFLPLHNSIDVEQDITASITFNEDIRKIDDTPVTASDLPSIVRLHADSLNGEQLPFTGLYANRQITIDPENVLQNSRTYYVVLEGGVIEDTSNNAITSLQFASFTTIATQTVFQPGDIVPVAYRMNADGADDEVALLALVNILPGTKVQMTDAKYTDNPQPQCAGGITWTSPDYIIPSGTVIVIGNDNGIASEGSISGSTFGLSSNGDQFILYTGTSDDPTHITALSSNAWVTSDHVACGGSLSKLPVTLVDGQHSISLSTAPGNISGNTVNAYYSGPQTGSYEELRLEILNPANWNGVEAGTPPQIWPDYQFPGPPSVDLANVINQTTIQVAFNRDMDPVSVTDLTHYAGIDGLTSISAPDNGALPDTIILTFNTPFENGSTYTLNIQGVRDLSGIEITGIFSYTFTYATTLSFRERYVSVPEDAGVVTLSLDLSFPSDASIQIRYEGQPFSTTNADDYAVVQDEISLNGNSASPVEIVIPILDDQLAEQDEYLVVRLADPLGVLIEGAPHFTLYIRDNDRQAPQATEEIELEFISRYTVENPDELEGLAEIVAFDGPSQRLFTMSTALKQFDIVDFADPTNPQLVKTVSTTTYGNGITSIAVQNGIVAVSVPGISNEQENGRVVFFTTEGDYLKDVIVGALPDMVTFTPDGKYVMTANEGQPDDSYQNDPEGSVSLIDISGGVVNLTHNDVNTLLFTSLNSEEEALLASGVRKLKASSTLSQDFEPEYITVAPDSKTAWITLQENNAVAVLDLVTMTWTDILPLGTKDYSAMGSGLDLSDRNSEVNIANWPLKGFFIPDAIANYSVNGNTYLITANEGDEKEYAGLNERTTISAVTLDADVFPQGAMLKENHNMGRMRITNLHGDTDGDGDYDELYCLGSRSFSIWNATSGERVYDSGDDFEKITSTSDLTAGIFNADNADNAFKGRSRAKGPEPEGLAIVPFNGRQFVFVTLERIGGVMVYDVTDPEQPVFTDYINTRGLDEFEGDHGPEGICYVSHPNGMHYIVSANEISGTLAVFRIDNVIVSTNPVTIGSQLQVFPNPVTGGRVKLSQPATFGVYDVHGRQIHAVNQATSFDVTGWVPGIYMIRLADGSSVKLVVVAE